MRSVLVATAIVGTLDIVEVCLFYWFRGVAPSRILKGIAAGILGREAAQGGGIGNALFGLALHYFIAFVVVAIYFAASAKFAVLRNHPIVMGAIYGLGVWAVMSYLVVPMSAIGPPARPLPPLPMLLNTLFAHIFCVGIPTALLAAQKKPAG
jgi:hypothetical protein